ncbi:MAG: hypothetical protein GTO45_31625 [Candidatus Aminicenantes bacterium]|nr:hypothetical protein [Candidatus Aminicenantes bacterium]NIM80625.1 hypothetical protein [Candidatus Aminicenantes bacterium]NIN20006.1 hypothetical protein [Candidatus Aminicenantes bacterium]NIN47984.1 hypothetical protein [Candidatus Aminicenantes bacterium]NIN89330.1 hypothetical protein [Candidatus Aminicenantes bacterium]
MVSPRKPSRLRALLHGCVALGILMAAVAVIVIVAPGMDPTKFGYIIGFSGILLLVVTFLVSYFIQHVRFSMKNK